MLVAIVADSRFAALFAFKDDGCYEEVAVITAALNVALSSSVSSDLYSRKFKNKTQKLAVCKIFLQSKKPSNIAGTRMDTQQQHISNGICTHIHAYDWKYMFTCSCTNI